MSRIVIDAREYSTSTGRYVSRLLQYLQRLDSVNDYLVLLKPADMERASFVNPRFKKIACPHKEFTFDEQLGLLHQLNGLKPDLVHFTMVQQPLLYRGRVVTTMQDLTTLRFNNPSKNPLVFKFKQQVYRIVNQRAAHKSLAIITPTEFVKQDVLQFAHIPADKITVTLEAADTIDDPAEPVKKLTNATFLMYVGRPTPHKNLGRLIEAYAELKTSHPDLKLVLVGKQDELYKRHAAAVQANGIKDVVFTGFVSDGQLRWLYEHCAAYVFPSLSEGFGLPGLEAMVHGAPVVSSNATCLPEVHGDAAHYFDPLNVNDMARAIADIIDDPALAGLLVRKGVIRVHNFSWKRMAQQTLAVYKSTIHG